jgi:hypothetical protein
MRNVFRNYLIFYNVKTEMTECLQVWSRYAIVDSLYYETVVCLPSIELA